MERPSEELNFCRIFRLPNEYPRGYCFNGGYPVSFQLIDWFNPWPSEIACQLNGKEAPKTWDEVAELLLQFLPHRQYATPGSKFILITDFGKSLYFEASA